MEKLTGFGASEGQLAKAKASRVWSQTHVPHCVVQWTISTARRNREDDVELPPDLILEQKHPLPQPRIPERKGMGERSYRVFSLDAKLR